MQLAPAKPIKPKAAAPAANPFINLFIFKSFVLVVVCSFFAAFFYFNYTIILSVINHFLSFMNKNVLFCDLYRILCIITVILSLV